MPSASRGGYFNWGDYVKNILSGNAFCQLLGIEHPICQAGMYQVAYGRLTAAVSKAGGLGVLGSAFMDPEDLRK